MSTDPIATWRRLVREADASGLPALFSDDVVFFSPIVPEPQRGKELTVRYLTAAFRVFSNSAFRYVREVVGSSDAALEFEVEINDTIVNGIDLISWNDSGLITEFKVMLRPLKAIKLMHKKTTSALQELGF